MAQEVILNVKATTADAIKNFELLNNTIEEQKQILIELEKELFRVENAQKQTSKTNLAAQTQLRTEADHLKNSIKDQRLALKELNLQQSNTKKALDSVHHSSQRVSSSFEDVAANGGAIAILDALTGGLASRIRDAFEATKLFNISLKGTRTALIATGVGALVVALGTIIAYWDDITNLITGANKKLEDQVKLNQKNLTELDHQLAQLELQKQILEANGESTAGINGDIEETILLRQEENRLLTENLKQQLEQEKAEIREVTFLESAKIQLLETLGLREQAAKAVAESLVGSEEERDRLAEINQQIRDSETKQLEFEAKLANLRKTERDKAAEEELKRREQGLQAVGFNLNAATKELDERQQILDAKLKQEGAYTENLKTFSDVRKQIDAGETEFRKQQVNETIGVLGNLQSVVGQQTVAGKALGIATALINTYQGASEALKQKSTLPSPFDVVAKVANVATVIATGLKTVKSITAVKVPPVRGAGGGGGGVSTPSAPSLTSPTATPQFNIIGGGATNQLAGLLAEQESKPVRAFVVSNEVSSAQSLDRNIVQSATLG